MDFGELVSKYSNRGEHTHIAVGIRPSGVIHLGNMCTIGLAGILGESIGPHLSSINLTVCDLDLPDACDWPVKEKGYVRYFDSIPSKRNRGETVLDYSMRSIEDFVHGVERDTQVDVSIRRLSSIQKEPSFREGLKRVLDTPGCMQFLQKRVPEGRVLVYPLCPGCNTSDPTFPEYKNGRIYTSCSNPECSKQGPYEVDLLDTERPLAVHFFIDPLRDRTIHPLSDIHVFGGDYNEIHDNGSGSLSPAAHVLMGEEGTVTKINKILRITELASGSSPDYLVGPTLYARDGSKMSKSKNNGLSLERLRDHFGQDYIGRVVNLMKHLTNKRFKNVDYNIIEENLFGKPTSA